MAVATPSPTDYLAPMTAWPAAIFFDFDGVIVNSEPLHFAAIREVLKREQIDLQEEEYYRELIGFDDRGAFAHMFAKHKRPLDPKTMLRVLTRKSETSRELIESRQYAALPGVEELVRGLWRNYPLAICSGALREEIESMLEGVNLRDCFPVIVAAEDVTKGKPDPEGYLLAAELVRQKTGLRFSPADCLVIEDAPTVIKSVNAAGFHTLAVATSHPLEELAHAKWRVTRLTPTQVLKQIPNLKIGV
jgi:HAD superfamily hydrolase (TIGR01509 family)